MFVKHQWPTQPCRPIRTPPVLPLRHVRTLAGLTLEEVANRIQREVPELSISRGTLSAIETGARGVSDLMLAALARAYGLPDDAFLTDYEPRERKTTPTKKTA